MTKPTFEQCLDHIETTLGCRLLDWQKEALRNFYDGKKMFYAPSRHYGIQIAYDALNELDKFLYEENYNAIN